MAVKGASKKKVVEERERNARIAELVCNGVPQKQVAEEFGLSQGRVCQIIAEKRLEWKAREEVAVGDHIQIQLAKLNKTYDQANFTYQRSLEDAKKVVTSQSETGESQTVTTEGQAGDTAALGIKLRCVEMALKLLNAFPKEDKTEVNNVVQINWSDLSKPIPHQEVIDITPSSTIEDRINAELNSPKAIPLEEKSPNGNGKH